ncbi:MAG: Ig-like domain-containing protein [Bacteroidota bacterium]
MKKHSRILLLLLSSLLGSLLTRAQQNLLVNPGFESGQVSPFEQGVTNGTHAIESNPAHVYSGQYSWRHESTGSDSYTIPWNGKVIASYTGAPTYELSAWVKANTSNTQVQLFIFSLDQNYGTTASTRINQTFTVGTSWQKISLTYTCPAGRKFVAIRLDLDTNGRTVWWDEVSLVNTSAGPEALQLDFKPGNFNDDNFRLSAAFGFSTSRTVDDRYRIYATAGHGILRWKPNLQYVDGVFDQTNPDVCSFDDDPRNWDSRCIEVVGLLSKSIPCNGNNACASNDLWDGYPGEKNVSTFVDPNLWPRIGQFGTNNYENLIDKDDLHAVPFFGGNQNCSDGQWCPPKTNFSDDCFVSNPDDYATGISNSKVTEVIYADGQRRWFMAFNIQLRNLDHPLGKINADDIWQAGWAWSVDGENWTIYDRFLFRNVNDPTINSCASGFLLSNMLVDDGYFYLVFNLLDRDDVLIARSQISSTPPTTASTPGFHLGNQAEWEITSGLDANGSYIWSRINGNDPININTVYSNGGRPVFTRTLGAQDRCYTVRQADIAKVYLDDRPDSPYRYIALAAEREAINGDCTTSEDRLYLYSTTDLSKPFKVESEVDLSGISVGIFGQEFCFTRNANQRTLADRIDLWMSLKIVNPNNPFDPLSGHAVSRKTMALSGQIFGNGSGAPATDITAPTLWIASPTPNQTLSGTVTVNGWALDAESVDQFRLEIDGVLQSQSASRFNQGFVCDAQVNREIQDPDCPQVGWQMTLNTVTIANGPHELKITAIDPSGNRESRAINIVVNNAGADSIDPELAIDVPTVNQSLTGSVSLQGWALDASTVDQLTLAVDGVLQPGQVFTRTGRGDVCAHPINSNINDPDCPQVGWQTTFNSAAFSNGSHSLTITAWDPFGNSKASTVPIVINNPVDNTPPAMWIDVPSANQSLSGNAVISGWAIDANSVDLIEVRVNGVLQNLSVTRTGRGDVCAHPVNSTVNDPDCPLVGWRATLPTTAFANGNYTLSVKTYDPAGNSSTQDRPFVISNGSGGALTGPSATVGLSAADWRVFPNPFTEEVMVSYDLSQSARIGWNVTSVDGQLRHHAPAVSQGAGRYTEVIATGEYPPGVYFLTLLVDGLPQTTRIIKAH